MFSSSFSSLSIYLSINLCNLVFEKNIRINIFINLQDYQNVVFIIIIIIIIIIIVVVVVVVVPYYYCNF